MDGTIKARLKEGDAAQGPLQLWRGWLGVECDVTPSLETLINRIVV